MKKMIAFFTALALTTQAFAAADKPLVIVSGQTRQLPSGDTLQLPDGVEIGSGTDTTVTRTGAGDISIEGNGVYRAGGVDVPVADGGTGSSTASGARTNLGVVIGTDVQGYSANLGAIAGLTSAADKIPYFTGSGTAALATCGSACRSAFATLAGSNTGDQDLSSYATTSAVAAGYQPLDSDLTIYAGLTPSANVQTLLGAANYAAFRSSLGVTATGADTTYAYRANNLSDLASASTARTNLGATTVGGNLFTLTNPGAITFLRVNADNSVSALSASAFRTAIGAGTATGDLLAANNLSDLANITTARSNLGLAIGSDVQGYDAELAALAGLTSAADKIPYFTGTGAASTTDLTSVARTLLAQTSQANMRSTGLGLGTAATQNTGTSGANVPLLNGANTWSAAQTFLTGIVFPTDTWNGDSLLQRLFFQSSGSTYYKAANHYFRDETDTLVATINGAGVATAALKLNDTDASNSLILVAGSNLTANRTLTITTGDASRTLTFTGDATVSGTNTGDQTTITGNAGTATALATARTIGMTGDVSWTSASFDGSGNVTGTSAIGSNKVTDAMLRQSAGLSIVGRSANTTGNVADVTAASDGDVLRRSGTTIGFGAIPEASVTNLTTDLAAKAPLASPSLTGTPTAPTAAAGTSTTQIATTAFVATSFAPINNPVFTGAMYFQQPAPASNTAATHNLTVAEMLGYLDTENRTTAITVNLPTGTSMDSGVLAGLAVDRAFEWVIINIGSSSGAATVTAATGHTVVGNMVCAISTSCRYLSRRTASNTWITYRIG